MSLTTDPTDPRLTRGVDDTPTSQASAYLVLSDEERAKGFVRPFRDSYRHVGPSAPKYPLRELTAEEKERHPGRNYVVYEEYPESDESLLAGRYWTQADLDRANAGCGAVTTMARAIAETYARNPEFYGATYCIKCQMHKPVAEFVWEPDGSIVGS